MLKQLKEYYDYPGISQSKLKSLLSGPQVFLKDSELFYEEKESLLVGSLTDLLLCGSQEDVEELYYIDDSSKPSDVVMSIVQEVYSKLLWHDDFDKQDDLILDACKSHNYCPTYNDSTRIGRIKKEGTSYWNLLVESEGKQIISKEQAATAWNVATSLLVHPHTKEELVDCQKQVAIYFEFQGIQCKALLDLLEYKSSVCPKDIKTMGDYTKNFKMSAKRYRYDIQAAFYTKAVSTITDKPIDNFKFIVESTKLQGCPLVYTCTNDDLHVGEFGRTHYIVGEGESFLLTPYKEPILGYRQLLDLYKWYEENGYAYDKAIAEKSGKLDLNLWL